RWVRDFFSYETPKSVVVKSWVVGVVNRGVQLLILAYFVGWVFIHEKAYQVRDTVIESSVVTKVKGIGHYAGRVLDTADYITPPEVRGTGAASFPFRVVIGVTVTSLQGTSVFVVVTKQIVTENQTQGVCPEVREGDRLQGHTRRGPLCPPSLPCTLQSDPTFRCSADRDCQGPSPATGSGFLTGRCIPYNGTLRACEIRGWCPAEVDTVDVPIMMEAENFTLFIKNSIRFPLFGFEK
ncbi:P2RX3 protein, partial [Ramphastos sulfuratus]|nr:P2RX3 protein [Ramphastos sulfuratus]